MHSETGFEWMLLCLLICWQASACGLTYQRFFLRQAATVTFPL